MTVDLTYTFQCSVHGCSTTETQTFARLHVTYGRVMPLPTLPPGWGVLGPVLVCPQHQLRVWIDEQLVSVPFYG